MKHLQGFSSLEDLKSPTPLVLGSLRTARSMDFQHARNSIDAGVLQESSSCHPRVTQTEDTEAECDQNGNMSNLDYPQPINEPYPNGTASLAESSMTLHSHTSDSLEDLRRREYPQLINKTYLDHTGTALYAKSLIDDFSADLVNNLYGNPHSESTPSAVAGARIEKIRIRALQFFNADPAHFDLVFVANATAAMKLVISCMADYAASSNTPLWYGYHKDAHTSIVGAREFTPLHRCFMSDEDVDRWISCGGLGGPRTRQIGLFAYPGQSNMTGRRLPLTWPGRIRQCLYKSSTFSLLDAAALASTTPLDLRDPATAPDFVTMSLYKIFGFPDIGALIVRKDSAHVLRSRKYFGGGTVDMVISVNDTWHAKKDSSIHDALEDGTLPFHSIFALDHAMNVHERLYGHQPMDAISKRTTQLSKHLFDALSSLRHANDAPVCQIYRDEAAVFGNSSVQGPCIAFNVLRADGSPVGYQDVEQAADKQDIYVRSGSLCNPGGMATYLEWSAHEMRAAYAAGHRCSHPTQTVFGKATGVVRVSLGAMSTTRDIERLIQFLSDVYVLSSGTPSCVPAAGIHQNSTPLTADSQPPAARQLPKRMRSVGSFLPSHSSQSLPPKSTQRRLSSVPLPMLRLANPFDPPPRRPLSRTASPNPSTPSRSPHPLQQHPPTQPEIHPIPISPPLTPNTSFPLISPPPAKSPSSIEIRIRPITDPPQSPHHSARRRNFLRSSSTYAAAGEDSDGASTTTSPRSALDAKQEQDMPAPALDKHQLSQHPPKKSRKLLRRNVVGLLRVKGFVSAQ